MTNITVILIKHRGLGSLLVRPLIACANGPGLKIPGAQAHLNFSGLDIISKRGWYTDNESGVRPVDLGSIPTQAF